MLCCAEPAGSHVDSRMCGVGINFQSDATGALTVQSLVPRSPAAIDGQIKAGDLLEQVDKERVFRSPMKRVAGLLLGPQVYGVRVPRVKLTQPLELLTASGSRPGLSCDLDVPATPQQLFHPPSNWFALCALALVTEVVKGSVTRVTRMHCSATESQRPRLARELLRQASLP